MFIYSRKCQWSSSKL